MISAVQRLAPISRSLRLRLLVIAGVLVGLLGVGFVASRVSPELVLVAVIAPPAILLTMANLKYGMPALLLTAAFVRVSLPTGTQSRIVASLLLAAALAGLWLARMMVIDRRMYLKPAYTNVPALGMIIVTIISYLWGNAFRDPLVVVWSTWPVVQLGALGVMVLLPSVFLLSANCVDSVRWLEVLFWIMVAVGAVSIVSYYAKIQLRFVNTGGLFSLWFVSLSFAQVLFNRKLSLFVRALLIALLAAWLYHKFAVEVYWLAGWLPPLIAVMLITLLRSRKAALVLALGVAIYVGINWGHYSNVVFAREAQESGVTRLAAWAVNWRVTGRHLLFGTGPAGYAAYYMSYFPSQAMATHSNYIDILSQGGVVSLFFVLWFFAALTWMGYKLCVRLKDNGDFGEGFANGALAGCVGCILAMALGDWLFPFVYTQTIAGFDYAMYSWLFLGGMVALSSLSARGHGR